YTRPGHIQINLYTKYKCTRTSSIISKPTVNNRYRLFRQNSSKDVPPPPEMIRSMKLVTFHPHMTASSSDEDEDVNNEEANDIPSPSPKVDQLIQTYAPYVASLTLQINEDSFINSPITKDPPYLSYFTNLK